MEGTEDEDVYIQGCADVEIYQVEKNFPSRSEATRASSYRPDGPSDKLGAVPLYINGTFVYNLNQKIITN